MIFALFLTATMPAHARTIIRDAEIEATLKEWTAPLASAAGISPSAINIILVQDPQINAFVAGGPNIFLYTGLIQKTKTPEELIGVIAHEMGHIQGGHLIAIQGAYERASFESILGAVIGIGAAVLSGQGDVGSAVIAGSQGIAAQRFLAFSRVHESAADQAALRLMEGAKIDPRALVSFMETLGAQELLPVSQQVEYVRTHPLTSNRIDAIEQKAQNAPHFDTPPEWAEQHARMKAKLIGFINPQAVDWTYDVKDQSVPALYAKTIAAYRTNRVDQSLGMIDSLLAQEPNNPYFHELKGQMLVEFGRLDAGIASYTRAVELAPSSGLLRTALAHAIIENGGDSNQAIKHLNRALKDDSRSPTIYRLLATAYGSQGNDTLARLNLAEEAVLKRNFSYAREQASYVAGHKNADNRAKLHARDILTYISHADKGDKGKRR